MFRFFKYFLTLLKISSFSLCSSSLLLSSLTTFIIIDINTSLVDHLSPLPLVVLGFYLVPSFGIYSSVTSFCITCCFLFQCTWDVGYVSQSWKSGLLWETSYASQQDTPLWSPVLYDLGCWQVPFWNPPSSLLASGPRSASCHQTLGTITGTSHMTQIIGWGNNPLFWVILFSHYFF